MFAEFNPPDNEKHQIQAQKLNTLVNYVSNPDSVEDRPTEGLTPDFTLDFEPKGYHFFCRGNCGSDKTQYKCRMGAYVIYLCANCMLPRMLDLMVVEPLLTP